MMRVRVTSLAAFALAGCACLFDPDPAASNVLDCIRGAEFSVSRGKRQIESVCIVPEPWVLLAIPARAISAEELIALGVAPELTSMLADQHQEAPRWCLAREVPTESVPEGVSQETARSMCTASKVIINSVFVAAPGTVRLVFAQSEEGTMTLTAFEAR